MKVKPIGNRVLVKPKKIEEKTAAGVYIPDTAKDKTMEGTVEAVGTAKDMPVKVGDRIIMAEYGGTEVKVDGDDLIIMDVKDILAILG